MRMMALAMLVFFVAIGTATLIESTYGIQTAKIIIYNALWFEILLVFLVMTLIANIVRYQMFKREKIAMLSFHLSFIIIIIGAGVTRYFGFEGMMMIREGESSNTILLADPHLWFKVHNRKVQTPEQNEKLFCSEQTDNYFMFPIEKFPNHASGIKIEYAGFKSKQIDTLLIDDKIKSHVLDIVTDGKKSNYVSPNGFILLGDIPISYKKTNTAPGIDITEQNGKLMFTSKFPVQYLPMSEMRKVRETGAEISDSMYTKVPTDSLVPLLPTTLYMVQGQQFVFSRKIDHAKMTKMSSGKKDVGVDILTLKITDGNKTKIVNLEGGMGQLPSYQIFEFNGLVYEMAYGSTEKEVPFSIACRDFRLDKYPGSETASSFESDVTVIDEKKKYKKDHRIFMNNVMDYGGYRFFQSSYDLDNPQTPENEEGTRLSVNYDFWGTNITYLGYLLMAIGMILSLFAPVGRFKDLLGKIKKSRERREASLLSLVILFSLFSFSSFSQEHDHNDHEGHNHATEAISEQAFRVMSKEHSEEFASLLIQDFKGRIVPAHTVCDELLRKIYGKNKYKEYNAIQTIMSMHMFPQYWGKQKIIAVPKAVRERLKLKDYASPVELLGKDGNFIHLDLYNQAHQKLESKRSEFDKKLIKFVERFEVVNAIVSWRYMKILPLKNDPGNNWYIPMDGELMKKDSVSTKLALTYLQNLFLATKSNSYGLAVDNLNALKKFQRKASKKSIIPSQKGVSMEISYNKMNIYHNAQNSYILLGLFLLIIFFIRIFKQPTLKSEKIFRRLSIPFVILIIVIFLYHGYGLGLRWCISGNPPWSNGYEVLIFISWLVVLIGLIFAKKYPVILALAAILAYFMLFVSSMELLDPEITPLQPVLKSLWLKIHVSIITGSYAFLGVGAIMGLLNLVLYNFRFKNNGQRITANINEITYISELIITIGLFMLTIGTFLGGIWANESWGRYWGWDPKETWALVSVLVYAIVLHLRYIPALAGKFTFNLVSLWAYGAILFTFFGVNFYLVGLHSYAQGDGLAIIPSWIYLTIAGFYIFTEISAMHYKLHVSDEKIAWLKYFFKKISIQISIILLLFVLQSTLISMEFSFENFKTYLNLILLVSITNLVLVGYGILRQHFKFKAKQDDVI